jgi:hypothetical protein
MDWLAISLALGIAIKVACLGAKFDEAAWGVHRYRMFFLVVAIVGVAASSVNLALGEEAAKYPLLLSILVWMMLDRHLFRPTK